MFRSRVAAVLAIFGIGLSAVMVGMPASAAPADTNVVMKQSITAKRATQVTCNGETFNYGGVTLGLGPRMSYYVGTRDGKIRMVKVMTNNGSNANFGLGAISWSGAVAESWSYGVSSYCITFPGSSQGAVIKAKQDGLSWSTRQYW